MTKFTLKPAHKNPLSFSLKDDGITQSLITAWRRCPTRARMIMQGYYRPGHSRAIIFGSVFHSAIEWSLNKYKLREAIHPAWFFEPENKTKLANHLTKTFQSEFEKADATGKSYYEEAFNIIPIMIPRYFKYWKEDFFGETKKEFIELERSFKVETELLTFKGKKDGVYKEGDDLWLLENKTKSQIPEDAISMTISRDLQVMLYILCHYLETEQIPKGVLYNIIRKPGLRKKIAESYKDFLKRIAQDIDDRPQHYFIRFPVIISWEEVMKFKIKLYNEMEQFIKWYKSKPELDPQYTHECNSVYGKCGFLEYCDSGGKDFSMLQVLKNHHPEL